MLLIFGLGNKYGISGIGLGLVAYLRPFDCIWRYDIFLWQVWYLKLALFNIIFYIYFYFMSYTIYCILFLFLIIIHTLFLNLNFIMCNYYTYFYHT